MHHEAAKSFQLCITQTTLVSLVSSNFPWGGRGKGGRGRKWGGGTGGVNEAIHSNSQIFEWNAPKPKGVSILTR